MPIFKNWDNLPIDPATGKPVKQMVIKGPDTTPHFVLTILTGGLWLPVWIIMAIVGQRRVTYR